MFLKSLTLKGFKSFADPTTLEFEPGVTVVVGPNGSGKSNVVDAVAWVLGAQGPSTVRSAKMEDVIFAGTPSRPALGRAEVSLTIDNSAGLLPIDFSEVTITRTLFRTGESEYAINRVPCRLLDIQELLSDTGVGRQQHVIVSQGNLDAILNSRPEDRRLVIEEAAGILKFRRRKERSDRRLQSTEASLVRLQDLLREVRRQLRPLEKQAEAARRHGDLQDELAAVRRFLLGRDLTALEGRLAAAARQHAELGRHESDLRHTLGRLDADLLAAESAAETARRREQPFDLVEAVSRAEGSKARAAGLAALLEERRRSVERILATTVDRDVIAALEAERAALVERLSAADQEAAGSLPAADELSAAEQQLAREAEEAAEQWSSDPSGRAGAAAEVRGELAAHRVSLDRSAGETQRLASRCDAIDRRIDRLTGERARLDHILGETNQADPRLETAERDTGRALRDADAALDAAMALQRRAETEQQRWAARREALSQALDAARARAGAARLADLDGVLGTLLELVEIDDGFEAAFEAAAGPALAAVIVDGVGAARRGLEDLQQDGVPGAVMAVPEAGAGWSFPTPDPTRDQPLLPSAIPLRPRVRTRVAGVADMVDRMLAGAIVVEGGWQQAVDLAVARPDLVVVTRSGDRCAGGIWQIGAGGGGVTGADLEEAARQADMAAVEAAAADRTLQATRRVAAEAKTHHDAAARALQANAARRQAAADNRQRVAAELAETISDQAAATAQQEEVARRLEHERARLSELQSLLPALEAEAEVEAARAAAERAARSRLTERTATVAAMRRDLEVRAAGLDERRVMTRRRLAEIDDRLRRQVAGRDEAETRRQELELAMSVTDQLMQLVASRQVELDDILKRLRRAHRAQTDAVQARADRLEQLRHQRSTAERQLGEARERINRAELEETEGRLRLETIVEAIRRDLECEPDAVRGFACPPLPPGTGASSRRAELERELRLMGPVNPLALEEHAALLERHQFLDEQLEDVRNARRELTKVIRAIDAEIVEVFRAAYADVADNFESLFATLFPGGVGRLRLTDPDYLLETGIEVEARPSGKNVRRLSLLSGGERSLTAMAFLFAVFRSRPSPFYLMDEVEAALDDVNLHRFLDLLHEFHAEAQLLVVSHQKRTMEAADCLYGVTMASAGSSRVISEKITIATPR